MAMNKMSALTNKVSSRLQTPNKFPTKYFVQPHHTQYMYIQQPIKNLLR